MMETSKSSFQSAKCILNGSSSTLKFITKIFLSGILFKKVIEGRLGLQLSERVSYCVLTLKLFQIWYFSDS